MNFQGKPFRFLIPGIALSWLLLISGGFLHADEIDCLKCHAKLKQGKTVHAALETGCTTCHGALDAATVPHKNTGQAEKGLSSDQPDLCFGCHDKALFSKQNQHAAISMGCTGCHNPHSSNNAKLLKAETPELCYSCHDRKPFAMKTVHAPVEGGMCLNCHNPHSSGEMALLLKKPGDVCLECHAEVQDKRHAVSGISAGSHPIVTERKQKVKEKKEDGRGWRWKEIISERKDPARPDKVFYCGSCHNPHSTEGPRLLKFNAKNAMDICIQCHKY